MNQMAISTIDKELLKYFTQLDEPQKRSLLELIKSFLKGSKGQGERVSLEQYNRELDEAMQRAQRGEYTTLEELEKEMEKW
jgi:type II secretory pathway predicted ATPase ExeA